MATIYIIYHGAPVPDTSWEGQIGDTFRFVAIVPTGYEFVKYCTSAAQTTCVTNLVFQVTVTEESGELHVYLQPITPPTPKPTPPPSPEGEKVGNNCVLVSARRFGTSVFDVKRIDNGQLLQTFEYYDKAKSFAEKSPDCNLPPPPAGGGEGNTVLDHLKAAIDGLSKSLAGVIAAAKQEAQERIKGLLDLETRIKAWITDMVFELLLKKLTEEIKLVPRR